MLAKERRLGDQRSRCGSIKLVGRIGKDNQVTRAGGMGHICCTPGAVGNIARFCLGVGTVDHLPAFGLAITGPIVGIAQSQEGCLDLSNSCGFLVGRYLLESHRLTGSRPARFK